MAVRRHAFIFVPFKVGEVDYTGVADAVKAGVESSGITVEVVYYNQTFTMVHKPYRAYILAHGNVMHKCFSSRRGEDFIPQEKKAAFKALREIGIEIDDADGDLSCFGGSAYSATGEYTGNFIVASTANMIVHRILVDFGLVAALPKWNSSARFDVENALRPQLTH